MLPGTPATIKIPRVTRPPKLEDFEGMVPNGAATQLEKVTNFIQNQPAVFRTIPPLDPKHLVRGQFNGYKKEKGVAPDSRVETFAAVRLEVHSWRWSGVPFLIRAGKCLPVTTTEVQVKLRKPPLDILGANRAIISAFALVQEKYPLASAPE